MKLLKFTLAVVFAVLGASAHAGIVTIDGTDVSFTYDPSSFVDGPGISGNGASFLSNSISAAAGGSSLNGSVSTSSSVSFIITLTNPNDSFSTVALSERGAYQLTGPDSSVSMNGSFMTIAAVSGPGSISTAITPNSPITQNDGVAHGWVAGASDDLSTGSLNDVRSIKVTIYNQLTASASAGSTADISAGFAGIGSNDDGLTVGVSATPLPASAPMLGAGLLLLLSFSALNRRRR